MGRGDMGFDGMYSLRAVEAWIAVINSNLNGTTRIGYKGSKLKFKGGVTEVVRAPQNALQGIQLPESALHTDQTSIDFSQGSIINSPELSHVAIQGGGFFILSDGVTQYFTRDGEFHIDSAGLLWNSQGLQVWGSNLAQASVTAGNFANFNPATGYNMTGTFRVAVTSTAAVKLQGLQFSKYGATVFVAGTSGMTATDGLMAGTSVVNQSLETSNTSLSQTIPELSLASKMFSAVSKIISVQQTNLDTVINLIR